MRQQTLRNTLSWNYDLLSPDEQTLFRKIAVFVGGCSLQAAEAISTALGDMTTSVLDSVTSLIDKNLLQQPAHGKDEPRLYIFEMFREYGLECLEANGELEQARDAHAAYYLALAEEAESTLLCTNQVVWQERLEQEAENLRAALRWLLERNEVEAALRLAAALRQFWLLPGYLNEDRSFLEQVLEVSSEIQTAVSPTVRSKALNAAGWRASQSSSSSPDALTAREFEVLRLLSMGLSNSQIAGRLVLSPHTVSAHIQSIYGKLGLNTRSAATRYALEHHLA